MPDALRLDLTEPDDSLRVVETEITVFSPEECRIDQEIDGMGRSLAEQALRPDQRIEMPGQSWQ